MRKEYDFRGGVRGKYARRYSPAEALTLDPDLARIFPTSRAVNAALRKFLAEHPKGK